jgi:two-component sensor histidine kinase
MRGLAEELFASHATLGAAQLEISGSPLMLPPRTALAMSMILHELITNAVKYGALASPNGHISLDWHTEGAEDTGRVLIRWRETGVTLDGPPTRTGFGSKMIEATARHELNGKAVAHWHSDGVEYLVEFPLSSIESPS